MSAETLLSAARRVVRFFNIDMNGGGLMTVDTQQAVETLDRMVRAEDAAAKRAAAAGLWRGMDSAPKDRRLLVAAPSGEFYVAHWVENPFTGDQAWLVSQAGEDQHLIKPTLWRELPPGPADDELARTTGADHG